MKAKLCSSYVQRLLQGLVIVLVLAVAAVLLRPTAAAQPDSPGELLHNALERARQAGSYHVSLDIQQTTSPERASAIAAPATRDESAQFVVEGSIGGPNRARLSIEPKQVSSGLQAQLASASPQEILIAGDTLYEAVEDRWVKKDGSAPIPGVNTDALSLLSVARDVQQLEAVERLPGRFERVGFSLQSRDVLRLMLSQKGAPDEHQLMLAEANGTSFGGTGELWIDTSGLPARLVLYLELKRSGDEAYRTVVLSTADYADFGAHFSPDLFDPTLSPQSRVSTSPLPGSGLTSDQLVQTALTSIALLAALVVCWLLLFARSRAKATAISLAMVIALVSPSVAGAAEAVRDEISPLTTPDLRSGQAALSQREREQTPAPGSELKRLLTETRAIADKHRLGPNSMASSFLPDTGDEDQDGLPNGYELSLGTNPFVSDTDMDGLSDYVEVTGFPCGDDPEIEAVETNPLLADSNGDGLRDGDEFHNGECRKLTYTKMGPDKPPMVLASGKPYAWRDDNDGDGVPDGLDLSPFTASADTLGGVGYYEDILEVGLYGVVLESEKVHFSHPGANLSFESLDADPGPGTRPYPFYVELQVRADPALMRAAYKKSVEWPQDLEGNIRNNGEGADAALLSVFLGEDLRSTGMLETVPYLEVTLLGPDLPSQEAMRQYNVTAVKLKCGMYGICTYKMIVPLVPVERNGQVFALQAKVLHDFEYGEAYVNRRWRDVRLKWAVQGDVVRTNDEGEYRPSPNDSYGLITYDTPYEITGMQVSRQGGTAMLVAGAYSSGTPELFNDGPIALLRAGMEAQFLSGQLDIDEVGARFDIGSSATITERWGITHTYSIKYGPAYRYEHLDLALTTTMMTTTRELLNQLYPSHNYSPTLILATEQRTSTINVDELGSVDFESLSLNFCAKPLVTSRSLKLQTYRYMIKLQFPAAKASAAAARTPNAGDWSPLSLDEMLAKVESEFEQAFPEVQDFFEDILDTYNDIEELYNEALNIVKMASTAWHMGQTAIQELADYSFQDTDQVLSDAEMLVKFLDQNGFLPSDYAQAIYVLLDVLQAGGPGVWLENQFNKVVSFVEGAIEKIGSFFDGSPGFSMPDEQTLLSWTSTAINVLNVLATITGSQVLGEIAQILTRLVEIYKFVKQLIDTITTVVKSLQSTAAGAAQAAQAFLQTVLNEAKALASSLSVVGLILQVGMTWISVAITLSSGSLPPYMVSTIIARAIVETIIMVVIFVIATVVPYGFIIMIVIALIKAIEAIFGVQIDPVSIFLDWFFGVEVTQLSSIVESETKVGTIQFEPVDPLGGMVAYEKFRLSVTSTVAFQGESSALDQSWAGIGIGGGPGILVADSHMSEAEYNQLWQQYDEYGTIYYDVYRDEHGYIRFRVDTDDVVEGGSEIGWAHVWKETARREEYIRDPKQGIGGDQYQQRIHKRSWADFVPRYARVNTWLIIWVSFETAWMDYYCSPYMELSGECFAAGNRAYSPPQLSKMTFDILPESLGYFWWHWEDVLNKDPDGDGLEGYRDPGTGQLVGPDTELCWASSHDNWDVDGDGMSDKFEDETPGVNPCAKDTDYDGLDDGQELLLGTLPDDSDTDDDGLKDGQEVAYWATDAISLTVPWRLPLSSQYPGLPDPAAFPNPRQANFDRDHRNDKQEKSKLSSPNAFDLIPDELLELSVVPHLLQGGGTGISVQSSPWLNDEGTWLDASLTITLPVAFTGLSGQVELRPRFVSTVDYNNAVLQQGRKPRVYTWRLPPIWMERYVQAELAGQPAIPAGPVTVTAQLAYSFAGHTHVVTEAALLPINLGGPTAEFDRLQAGTIFTGETTLRVNASDPELVSEVYVCAKTTSPCSGADWQPASRARRGWSYPWTPLADDVYTLQAYGIDRYGLPGPASAPITVSVDSAPPTGARFDLRGTVYLSTTALTETMGVIRLTGRVSETAGGGYVSGLDDAVLLIDDGSGAPVLEKLPVAQPGQISSTFSYDWPVPSSLASYETRNYDLALGATDRAGNASSALDTLRVIIDDEPPSVYTRLPQVAAGATLTLSGRADDTRLVPGVPYTPSMALAGSDTTFTVVTETSRALVVGDLNGDTLDDVVLIEPATMSRPFQAGLFFGQPGGLSATLTIADADVLFQGEALGIATYAPSAAGHLDVNGDGVGDLLLGDPLVDSNQGRAYLILGRRGGGWTTPFSLADADWQLSGNRTVALGSSLASAGDVNGDGLSDFMLGMASEGSRAGAVYLFLGRQLGGAQFASLLRSPHPSTISLFPPNMAGLGDTDGDGLSDLIIAYTGEGAFSSAVALVCGRSKAEWPAGPVDLDAFADALFSAPGSLQTVSSVGDVNADGLRDLLIGDPSAAQQRVFVVFGRPRAVWSPPPKTLDLVTHADASYLESSPSAFTRFGAGLTPIGDLDRDGRADFAMGNFSMGGPIAMPHNAGVILASEMSRTLNMSPWSAPFVIAGSANSQRAGEYLSSGDVNGDGARDLLLGAPGEARAYLLEGEVDARLGSGVREVALGLYGPVADPSLPYTQTLPATWQTATLAILDGTITAWSAALALAGDGDYRVYARARDRVGNAWTAQRGYLGNVWVNTGPVTMTGASASLQPPRLLSKTYLSLTGIVTSPQPIQQLRVYDGYDWYRHWPVTGTWSNNSVVPRADRHTLTFRAVARDAFGNTLHVSRTLTTDTFALPPVLSANLAIGDWQTDISPTLETTWPAVLDASGIVSSWATIDTSPGTVPTTPVGANQVVCLLDQPSIYYGHAAVRDGAGNSHLAHSGPFLVNRGTTPSIILPDGHLDLAGGEYPEGTLLNYDPYAAIKPVALWGTWNADELYLGLLGNPWGQYDRLAVYLDTGDGGITRTLAPFGVTHTLPFEADFAFVIGEEVTATARDYALYQVGAGEWTELISPTSMATTLPDTEIVLDRAEIQADGSTPVQLLAYAEDEAGVWAILPGGAHPTTTSSSTAGSISGTVAFAGSLAWPELRDGVRPNAGQDQVIAPIIELVTDWDTILFSNTMTVMSMTVSNPDIGPYVNVPVTVTIGLTETPGLAGLVGTPVGARCISCPVRGQQWVLGVDVDAYSTQTVTLFVETLTITRTGVFSLPVRAQLASGGLSGRPQPAARAQYNVDQGVATLQLASDEPMKYVQSGPAGLDVLPTGDFLGCWQTLEVDMGAGFQQFCPLGDCPGVTGRLDPDSSQVWRMRVRSANGRVSPVVTRTLVTDEVTPTAHISPVVALVGKSGVIRGLAQDAFPTTRAPRKVEVSINGGRFMPAHMSNTITEVSRQAGAAEQVKAAWTFPMQVGSYDGKLVQVVARAIDEAGNVGPNSDPVTVTLDGVGPVITVTQAITLLAGQVSDGSGVASVELSLDGGASYLPANLSGSDWAFDPASWSGPKQEFAIVRAQDVWGNVTHKVAEYGVAVATQTGVVSGAWYELGGTCARVYFTDTGSLTPIVVTVTLRHNYPSVNLDGLPRRYDITGSVGSGFEAMLAVCYQDAELVEAGIPLARESELHLYRYPGAYTWTAYSQVDPVNNLVTATNVTELGIWGLGVPGDQPTAIRLPAARVVGSDLGWIGVLIGVGLCLAGAWWVRRHRQMAWRKRKRC